MVPFDFVLNLKILQAIRDNRKATVFTPFSFCLVRVLLLLVNLINNIFFLIDAVLFRRYTKTAVKNPIFIVGPPRTGTTFLHQTLSENPEFTAMKSWEMFLAPSITQKYLLLSLGKIDRLVGAPLFKLFTLIESKGSIHGDVHTSGLFAYEEDCNLFTFTGNSPYLIMFFPFPATRDLFCRFDEAATQRYKNRYMNYYKKCIQKHLYVFGSEKIYISKNPTYSGYVKTLSEKFEGAKFIYTYRIPYEVVPSSINLFRAALNDHKHIEQKWIAQTTIEILKIYYTYPLEALDFSKDSNIIIRYPDLVSSPMKTIEKLLEQFNFELTPEFRNTLVTEENKAKNYKSKNTYTLEQHGVTKDMIEREFKTTFEQFEPTLKLTNGE